MLLRPLLPGLLWSALVSLAVAQPPAPTLEPLMRVVDLDVGQSQTLTLSDGQRVTVELLELNERRDPLRRAMRHAEVRVRVNDETVTLVAALYRLPTSVAGVQIDCAVTRGYVEQNAKRNPWGLVNDARLRLWPAGSPLTRPGTFSYPLKQRWFATATQTGNEPVYVDGGEKPANKNIYYHYGYDFGGAERMVDVVAATDGLVVSSGLAVLPGYDDSPVRPRYDVVYVLDARGWYYRYSHLATIDEAIRPGQVVQLGQKIGLLGKEGGSGGWSHLHFDISFRQPSGLWGISDSYALAWEAYQRDYRPELIAVARPHHFVRVGDPVLLDGSRSWARAGVKSHGWHLSDGSRHAQVTVEQRYSQPGTYSEVLQITDEAGNIDYDFAIVNVIDPAQPERLPPTIHAAYAPTWDIRPGDEVTFKVRTFRTTDGEETWNFGDGTPLVTVRSDGNQVKLAPDGYAVTTHRYAQPGHYLVSVERTNAHGHTARAHLHVRVEAD